MLPLLSPAALDFFGVGLVLIGYIVLLALLSAIVPGYVHQGTPLSDGSVMKYKINGLRIFLLLLASGAVGHKLNLLPITYIYDNYGAIFCWANIIAFGLAKYLFIKGKKKERNSCMETLAEFWEGNTLTPKVFGINIKFFWLRPSMMMWIWINLSFLAKHMELLNGQVSILRQL